MPKIRIIEVNKQDSIESCLLGPHNIKDCMAEMFISVLSGFEQYLTADNYANARKHCIPPENVERAVLLGSINLMEETFRGFMDYLKGYHRDSNNSPQSTDSENFSFLLNLIKGNTSKCS